MTTKWRGMFIVCLAVLRIGLPEATQAADWFVTTNGTGDGSSWSSPTNSIQGAIDASTAGDTVWVSNGVYEVGGVANYPPGATLTNRVAIYKAITVRSANDDQTNTVIKGRWNDGYPGGPVTSVYGNAAVRCVYMINGSSLIGFMLTNGATMYVNDNNGYGGGVWCQSTNTVISTCVIAGNAGGYKGGGAYYGTLSNCRLTGNAGAYQGAGTYGSSVHNCTLTGNSVTTDGGGAYNSALFNCALVANSANNGGGAQYGSLFNCTLTSNNAVWGGGAQYSALFNCALVGNSGNNAGGGTYDSTQYNCTLTGNATAGSGGGACLGTLYNCVSWDNNKADAQVTAYYSCGAGYTNGGSVSGNITNDPMFVNKDTANYRLSKTSPCVNAGTNASWMTEPNDARSKDLDGRSRIDRFSGQVDMGCYEYLPRGTMFSFR